MANATFQDYFAGGRMTQIAEAATVKANVPRVLPDPFYAAGPTKPFDDKVQYPSVTWNRNGIPVIARNSPPRAISLGNAQWNFATVFNMKEEMEIPPDFIASLFSNYGTIADNARMELNRRMIQFNQRADLTRTGMVHSLFANGKIWIGSDGQVLASSSGAVITMDPGIPTGNKFTKDGAASTYNIGDWSSTSTDIGGNLRTLQNANVQANGYLINTLVYGTSIPGYLAANTTLNGYFQRNQLFRDTLVTTNDIPNGFLGMNWIPARLAYSVSAAGTATATFASNFLAAMPQLDNGWYEFVEGGTLVPNGVAGGTEVHPNTTIEALLNLNRVVNGKYAYGVYKSYPVVGTSMVQGDCAGPVLKVPGTSSVSGVYYFGTCS